MPWLTISALMQLVSMVRVTSITVLLTNRALMANELNFVFNWLAVRFQRNKLLFSIFALSFHGSCNITNSSLD